MGLSSFPSPGDGGVIPVLLMNTVISVTLFKNMVRSALQLVGILGVFPQNVEEESSSSLDDYGMSRESLRTKRKISITQFKFLFSGRSSLPAVEDCSVCLCGFKREDEVSQLSCKHFFHKHCLEKWFHNSRSSCPLCRSVM